MPTTPNYKQTEIGEIPQEWEISELGLVSKVATGGTPNTKIKEYYFPGIIRWMKSGDVKGYIVQDVPNRISEIGLAKSNAVIHPVGSVMMAMSGRGKTRGNTTILGIPCSCSQSVAAIIPDKKIVDSGFLHYDLYLRYNEIRNITGSDDRSGLNLKLIRAIKIPLPKLVEQQKITNILSVMNDAIQKTNEIISKTQELKKGLMQHLLTRGIGHTQFKQTEIGKIPQEWELVKIGIILSLEYGVGLTQSKRVPGKYPVYGSNGIVGFHDQAYTNGPGVIVGRKGSVGAVNWIESDFWPIDTTYYVDLKRNDVSKKWMFYKLLHLNLQRLNTSTGVPGLNRNDVYSLTTSLPNFNEQKNIGLILSNVDEAIEQNNLQLKQLESLKNGLMQVLLTGKVRVKIN